VYGLDWHAGHAIVGDVVNSDGHSVTRELRGVRGRLAAGTKVALDSSVYEGNPKQTVGCRLPTFPSRRLGAMPAWLIAGRSHTWAIVVHGINGNREDNLRIVPTLHRVGTPVLL